MEGATPLLRQWQLITLLSVRHRGATVRELADEFSVTQRTIRRDLHTLQAAGFPLDEIVSDHGRKHSKLGDSASGPPLSFTWDEAVAIFLARRHLEPLAGTPLWASAQRAFRKIRAMLSEQAIRYLEKMTGVFHRTTVGAGDYETKGDAIDQLMIAIEDRRIAFITYQSMSSTEPVTYEIYSFGIVFHRHSLYLVAHSVSHEEVRHFKIDRLGSVELETLKFQRPAEFDLQKHLADSFGIYQGGNGKPVKVRIRFSSEVARYVEESRWHPNQQITRQHDGGVLFEVTLNAFEEIKSWVLSFGRHAEVLGPPRFREELLEDVESMRCAYETRMSADRSFESKA